MKIPFTSIIFGDRLRKEYPEVDVLAASIHDNGIIHPMTVSANDSPDGQVRQYELIAGGRRYQAYLKLRDLHPGLYDFIPVTTRNISSVLDLRLLELEENFRREDMTWQEKAVGIFEYHILAGKAMSKKGTKWTQTMTAQLCNISQAQVSQNNNVAELLKKNDKEIWEAESYTAALKIILERQLREAQTEKLRRIDAERKAQSAKLDETRKGPAESTSVQPTQNANSVPQDNRQALGASSIFDTLEDTDVNLDEHIEAIEREVAATEKALEVEAEAKCVFTQNYLRSLIFSGDCVNVLKDMKTSGVKIDHIITDPPYGIDMANLDRMANIGTIEDTHDVAQNVEQFEPFLTAAFDLLPSHGFLAMWYDLDHHETLRDIAKKVGFKVQRWPFIWCKTTPCSNSAAQYNFTKSTEVCYIFRKSASSILVDKQANNFIVEPNIKDARHPFAKPHVVWERLIKALTLEGQTILDPFCGSGSCLLSSLRLNRLALGIEVDEVHIAEAVELLGEKLNADFKKL